LAFDTATAARGCPVPGITGGGSIGNCTPHSQVRSHLVVL
jgi:hypothetical protein